MLALALTIVVIILKLFPRSSLAVFLHRHLVERPVERLASVERHHIVFALLVIAALLIAQDLLPVAGPADMAFAFLWDVSIYLDLTGVALAVTALRWTKVIWTLARPVPRKSGLARCPRPRSRTTKPIAKPSNDDDVHRLSA